MITAASSPTTATRPPVAYSYDHQEKRRPTRPRHGLTPCMTSRCQPPPHSLDALDLSSSSPTAAFTALHDRTQSHPKILSQLESRLPVDMTGQLSRRCRLQQETGPHRPVQGMASLSYVHEWCWFWSTADGDSTIMFEPGSQIPEARQTSLAT